MPLEAAHLILFPNIENKAEIAESLTTISKKYSNITDFIGGLSRGDDASRAVLTDDLILFIIDYLESVEKPKRDDELFNMLLKIFIIDNLKKIKPFVEMLCHTEEEEKEKQKEKKLAWAAILFANPSILPDDFYARSYDDLKTISQLDLRYLKRMDQFLLMIHSNSVRPLPFPVEACVLRINQLLSHYGDEVDLVTAALINIYDAVGIEALIDPSLNFSEGPEAVIAKFNLYAKLSKKARGPVRGQLIKKIDEFEGENKDTYINALNKIIDNKQLSFPQTILDHLKNSKWFSLDGLKKLDKIIYESGKYLEPKGLMFLDQLNAEKLSTEEIELLKNTDDFNKFDRFPNNQDFHGTVFRLLDNQRKLNELMTEMKPSQTKKENKPQLLPTLQPSTLTKKELNAEALKKLNAQALKEGFSLLENRKFIFDPRVDGEDEKADAYIIAVGNLTFEDLKDFYILSSIAELSPGSIFRIEDIKLLFQKSENSKIKNPYNPDPEKLFERKDFCVVSEKNLDLKYLNNLLGFDVDQVILSENGLSPEKNALLFFMDKLKTDISLLQDISPAFFEDAHFILLKEQGVIGSILAHPEFLTSIYIKYGYPFTCGDMASLLSKTQDGNLFKTRVELFAQHCPLLFSEFHARDDEASQSLRKRIYLFTFNQIDANSIKLTDEIYQPLREKYKADLLVQYGTKDENQALTEFKKAHDIIFSSLNADLKEYEDKRLRRKKDGALRRKKFSITKPERLIAYQALDGAVKTGNLDNLRTVIGDQKVNIGLEEPRHRREGLQEYVWRVVDNIKLFYEQIFPNLLRKCPSDDRLLAACLLDDTFYHCLSNKQLFLLSQEQPEVVLELLVQYRPEALGRRHPTSQQTLGVYLAPLTKKIPKIPVFSDEQKNLYQWQDLDLTVALHTLIQQKKDSTVRQIILPLGNVEYKDHLLLLGKALSKKQNHLVFSVCNVNSDHYVLIVAREALDGKKECIVINPAYDNGEESNDKQKTKSKIKQKLIEVLGDDCNIEFPDVIQQFDGSSCAIACVQTIEDIFTKNAIRVSEGRLTVDESLLTLNAYQYCGKEEQFQELLMETRKTWEFQLSGIKEASGFYYDFDAKEDEQFQEFPQGAYSLEANQSLQKLLQEAKDLLNQLTGKFREKYEEKIQTSFSPKHIEKQLPDDCYRLINEFLQGNDNFEKYTAKIEAILEINSRFQSEVVKINEETPREYLEKAVFQINAAQKIEKLCEYFYKWLVEQKQPVAIVTDHLMGEFKKQYPVVSAVITYAKDHDVDFKSTYEHFCEKKQQEVFEKRSYVPSVFSRPSKVKVPGRREKDQKQLENPAIVIEEKNKITISTDDSQSEIEALKTQLIDALNYLKAELDKYPKEPQFNLFTGSHRRQKLIFKLKAWSDKCINDIEKKNVIPLLKDLQFEMAGYLFLLLEQRLTKWNGQYSHDSLSLHNLVRAPLATLMGMTKEEINNKHDLGTRTGCLALQADIDDRIGKLYESLNIPETIQGSHELDGANRIKMF